MALTNSLSLAERFAFSASTMAFCSAVNRIDTCPALTPGIFEPGGPAGRAGTPMFMRGGHCGAGRASLCSNFCQPFLTLFFSALASAFSCMPARNASLSGRPLRNCSMTRPASAALTTAIKWRLSAPIVANFKRPVLSDNKAYLAAALATSACSTYVYSGFFIIFSRSRLSACVRDLFMAFASFSRRSGSFCASRLTKVAASACT